MSAEESDDAIREVKPRRPKMKRSGISAPPPTPRYEIICYRCGTRGHSANKCEVTKGRICRKCGKAGHFANVCRSKSLEEQMQYISIESSDDSDDFTWAVSSSTKKHSSYTVNFNDYPVDVLIDSGSTVNIISKSLLKSICPDIKVIKPYSRKVFAYNIQDPLDIMGSVKLQIKDPIQGKTVLADVLIIKNQAKAILGNSSATALNLLRVGPQVVNQIHCSNPAIQQLLERYSDRFTGLGKLRDIEVKVHTDESIQPMVQKARRLPVLMQKEVDVELEKLLAKGVIEKVSTPPAWVNPLVVVPKKNKGIRICVDMRVANSAIIREPYQIPTLEEVLLEFNGCTKFATLDLNQGYHQLALSPESRDLTAFACHRGIFRYTRLIFGMSAAAEVYQKHIEQALAGLPGTKNISDDIIIGGKDEEEL